jgi:hypothetical protein
VAGAVNGAGKSADSSHIHCGPSAGTLLSEEIGTRVRSQSELAVCAVGPVRGGSGSVEMLEPVDASSGVEFAEGVHLGRGHMSGLTADWRRTS